MSDTQPVPTPPAGHGFFTKVLSGAGGPGNITPKSPDALRLKGGQPRPAGNTTKESLQ